MGTQALVFVKMTLESGQGLETHGHRAGALRDRLQDACGPRVGKCSCWNPWAAVLGCEWEAAYLGCSTAFACEAKLPTLATVQSIQGNNLKRRRDGKEEESAEFHKQPAFPPVPWRKDEILVKSGAVGV